MKDIKRSYIREILDAINKDTISFAGGLPNEKLFPKNELKKAAMKVFEDENSLQYSKSQGIEPLREKIASIYTKYFDFPTTKDEILITTGSQQAFDIITKSFVSNKLVVQNPTYIGALSAFSALELEVEGYDEIEQLNEVLDNKKALYLMSDFSNPTSKCLSEEDRKKLSLIVNEKDSFVIEDGAYAFLDFDGKINKPISSMCKKSFHLGSFSKIVAPGLRVGWVRASNEYINKIIASKEAIDLHTSTLNQMIINEFLEENDLFEHINKVRDEYKSKMECMADCFEKYIPSFEFKRPNGGMFIYGDLKKDSFEFAKKALEHNVAFVPATVFLHDGRISSQARFNFTNSTNEKIEEGVKKLASII